VDFIYGKKVNVKKIAIFETGSDFAAINFDVLKKNNWKNFELNTAYNRVVMLIEKVTDLYAEWIKML
jgi:hypothetical protein